MYNDGCRRAPSLLAAVAGLGVECSHSRSRNEGVWVLAEGGRRMISGNNQGGAARKTIREGYIKGSFPTHVKFFLCLYDIYQSFFVQGGKGLLVEDIYDCRDR